MAAFLSGSAYGASPKLIVAHRGASGYLPEHTLEAKALAYGMGADYLEQDVVLTKDDQLIVLHDIHLDTVTDVKRRFPERARRDGRYYALDFTLAEIQSLRAHERIDIKTGKAVYGRRFPTRLGNFRVPSLDEEIELIQGLNHSRNRNVGLFLELKEPAWHHDQGRDLAQRVLETMKKYGYQKHDDPVILQCFDADELQRLRGKLKCKLKLCQLIGGDAYDHMRTPEGVRRIAKYADSIGPEIEHLVSGRDDEGRFIFSELVDVAHKNKLKVYPYTLRADQMPKFVDDFEELLNVVLSRANADGAFTDFPDRMANFLNRR